MAEAPNPMHAFRFQVTFQTVTLASDTGGYRDICQGAFSEVSGLEATVEPLAISEGGINWGQHQRAGRTSFSTVILKRGLTTTRDLWNTFQQIHQRQGYKNRLKVTISLYDIEGKRALYWTLEKAMPVKMKLSDFNAAGAEVGVEELHLVHEGITETMGDRVQL